MKGVPPAVIDSPATAPTRKATEVTLLGGKGYLRYGLFFLA